MFRPEPSYTYSDIGLKPIYLSNTQSRNDIDTSTNFLGIDLSLPVVAAPMAKVVGVDMARQLGELGGLAFLPRSSDSNKDNNVGYSLTSMNVKAIPSIPAKTRSGEPGWSGRLSKNDSIVCIDLANAYSSILEDAVGSLKENFPGIKIITGNVASVEGYAYLAKLGVDAIRVGIGGGSVCTTSIATGVGVGQATIVREISEFRQSMMEETPLLIADGGIKTPADVCKALALGADVVMVGGLFAGTAESPGEVVMHNGKKYKHMAGQASMHIKGQKAFVEGADLLVPYKGPVERVWTGLEQGLKSSMSYMGCTSIVEFKHLEDECFVQLGAGARYERGVHAHL